MPVKKQYLDDEEEAEDIVVPGPIIKTDDEGEVVASLDDEGQIILTDGSGHEIPTDTQFDEKGNVTSDGLWDIITYNPDKLKRGDSILNRNQSSILSMLSSISSSQNKILSYILSSELMFMNYKILGDVNIGDAYNALWLYTNVNMFLKDKYATQMTMYSENTVKAALSGMKWLKKGDTMPESTKQIINVIRDNGMKFVTNLGTDISKQLTDVLSRSLTEGMSTYDLQLQIAEVINGNMARASTIARTETMRACNAASYSSALSNGYTYFIVDNRAEACELCQDEYEGQVFPIEQVEMLPPLHPNCACVPLYFNDNDTASEWADDISKEKQDIRTDLVDDGKTIATDGTSNDTNN